MVAQTSAEERVRRPPIPHGPYLIVGLARAGRAAAHRLSALLGASAVRVWDDSAAARRRHTASVSPFTVVGDEREALLGARAVVKSPGVPLDHPLLARARAGGLPVLDELELGWRLASGPTIAVTGTNGKSTTVALIAAAMTRSARQAAVVGNVDPEQGIPFAALDPGYDGPVVAEVSSFQAAGLHEMLPDAAVFTNLTQEHTQWHGSMRAYALAKRRLFIAGSDCVPLAVINRDDKLGRELLEQVGRLGGSTLSYGRGRSADYRVIESRWDGERSTIALLTPLGQLELRTPLWGAHNAENVAAALALCDGIGLDREQTLAALHSARPPAGRLEHICAGQSFDVFVDFAHSPDAIQCVLSTLRTMTTPRKSRLIVVCGLPRGSADVRELAGRVARLGCDHLILTAWSAYGEPRMIAFGSVLAGARRAPGARLEIVLERRAAIGRALSLARPGDVVAILGRGARASMAVSPHAQRVPFDDRQVVRELLIDLDERERASRRATRALVA